MRTGPVQPRPDFVGRGLSIAPFTGPARTGAPPRPGVAR